MDEEAGPPPRRFLNARNIFLVCLGLLWTLVRFAFAEVGDDAYITFTHAKNLVEGHGLVVNPGEYVLGTTSPPYALWVALGLLFGIKPWVWTLITDIAMGFVILWLVRRLMEAHGSGFWFPIAGVLIVSGANMTLPAPGMETAVYIAVILAALSAIAREEPPIRIVAWGTTGAMVRPDGLAILAVALLFGAGPLLWKKKWKDFGIALSPLLALAIQLSAIYIYYGDVLPHSVRAKSVLASQDPWDQLIAYGFPRDHVFFFGMFFPIGLFAIAGLVRGFVLKSTRSMACFYVAMYLGFAVSKAPMGFIWYRIPLYILMFVFAVEAFGWIVGMFWKKVMGEEERPALKMGAAAFVMALLFAPQAYVFFHLNRFGMRDLSIPKDFKAYRKATEWVNSQDPDPYIACFEIGYISYYTEGRIYDMSGLITPSVVEAVRENPEVDRLEISEAEWFIHSYWRDDIARHYQLVTDDVATHGFERVKNFEWENGGITVVYERKVWPYGEPSWRVPGSD